MAKALLMITQLLGRNRPEDDLSTHFRQQAEEKDDPWKKKRAALRRRTATWDAEFQANSGKAWDELRHHFAKAGFNALVTEEVAQELAYILEASPLQQYRRARALLQMSTADRLSLHNFAVAETREKDLNMGSYDQRPPCTTLPCIPRPRRHQPKVTCPDGKLHHNSNRCRLNKATASQCNTFIIYLAFVIPIFTFWFTLFPSKVWLLKPPLFRYIKKGYISLL